VRLVRGSILIAVVALAAACGRLERHLDTPALIAHLDSADPSERARAVSELARRATPLAIPGLVARLRDEDGGIRLMASAALHELTSEDLGYRSFDPEPVREKAVVRWEAWLEKRDGGSTSP
jgi:HEAT repeat protein